MTQPHDIGHKQSDLLTKKVYLVGAGPGDPELITLRGANLLRQADVILFDGLVNASILKLAKPSAEMICVGKHGHGGVWTQSQINDTTVRFAKTGKTVVRLKGGDTSVFARTAEEIERLLLEGIPYEVVPGITAALAISAYTGIPVTHRDWASAVALVTGQFQSMDGGEVDEPLDWKALAKFPGTIIVYMGVTTVSTWSQKLLEEGKARTTPVAIIRKCSLPDQQVLRCNLGSIADMMNEVHHLRPPVVCVIGEVVDLGQKLDWFSKHTSNRENVWVTSPLQSALRISSLLEGIGMFPVVESIMYIDTPDSWTSVDANMHRIDQYDVVAFSSSIGVEYFFDRFNFLRLDTRRLSKAKIAAVGNATAEQLQKHHLTCDLVPTDANSNALGELLAQDCRGKRYLFVRNPDGEKFAMEKVASRGGIVESVEVYQQRFIEEIPESILHHLNKHSLDAILVTSKNIAKHTVSLLGEHAFSQKWYSLSESISECLRQLGCQYVTTSPHADFESLVASLRTGLRGE